MVDSSKRRNLISHAVAAVVEFLEGRRYLTGVASLNPSTHELSITGDSAVNYVSLGRIKINNVDYYKATIDGVSQTFANTEVSSISISTGAGDDQISLSTAITDNVTLDGGSGTNSLYYVGTTSADSLTIGDLSGSALVSDVSNLSESGITATVSGISSYQFDGKKGLDTLTVNSPVHVSLFGSQVFQSIELTGTASAEIETASASLVTTRNLSLGRRRSLMSIIMSLFMITPVQAVLLTIIYWIKSAPV